MTEESPESSIPVAEMPTIKLEEWVENHKTARNHQEAHPIDEDLKKETIEDIQQDFHLSVIQAVLSNSDVLDRFDEKDVRKIEETDSAIYYQVKSSVFYAIFVEANRLYNKTVQVEEAERAIDLHTLQFLKDLHGYTGDFGGQTGRDNDETFDETLCNAINDPTPYEGDITIDTEPENGHYRYIDARGLIFEKDTHPN